MCRSLLLLLLRNQIILVKCSAHKHSDSVNAAHANKRTVCKMVNVHGVLGMRAVVCWIKRDKELSQLPCPAGSGVAGPRRGAIRDMLICAVV